ncbi:hypothetical protein NKH28_13860 [Mesorhizobium sp. M1227]
MSNAIIPLPTAKPDLGVVAEIPESGIETAGAALAGAKTSVFEVPGTAQHQSIEKAIGARPVRVVGPAFFPAD